MKVRGFRCECTRKNKSYNEHCFFILNILLSLPLSLSLHSLLSPLLSLSLISFEDELSFVFVFFFISLWRGYKFTKYSFFFLIRAFDGGFNSQQHETERQTNEGATKQSGGNVTDFRGGVGDLGDFHRGQRGGGDGFAGLLLDDVSFAV